MKIYDGSKDIKPLPTKHTISVVSSNRIADKKNDCMTIRKNGREDWSLFFCESGQICFEDEVLLPGNIWIYPPLTPQKYTVYSKDKTAYRYLHFSGSDIENMLKSLKIEFCAPIEVENTKFLLKAFDNIQMVMYDNSTLSRLTAEYQTLFIISMIAKNKKRIVEPGIIKRVTDNMEHTFAERYDASHYAKILGVSESRFNHIFKERLGISPYMYILNLRIDNADVLLSETNIKIKDIAMQCGFEDPLYFTQAFKRAKGITPSQYRKMNLFHN